MKKIAWIIPCYNEEQTIGPMVVDILRCCPHSRVFVFDNNSSDRTASIAAAKGATVVAEPNQGKGHVVRSMFRKVDADIYILIDGDMTYDVKGWEKLIAPIVSGKADMVVGNRIGVSHADTFRPFHQFGNILITGLINVTFRTRLRDVLSGYRAFSRDLVKHIYMNARGFEVEVELTVQALELGFTVQEIPLAHVERPEGSESKLSTVKDGLRIVFTIIRLAKDYKPLMICSAATLICVLIGAGLQLNQATPLTYTYFYALAALSFFSGLILDALSQRFRGVFQVIRKISGESTTVKEPEQKKWRKASGQ